MTHRTTDPTLETVLLGLAGPQKSLPPSLFYDDDGSRLFERITELDEYYVTRAESEALGTHGARIGEVAAGGSGAVVVIEPGCGTATKVEALIPHLPLAAYVGVDVAGDALRRGVDRLRTRWPRVQVHAVHADYHHPFHLPPLPRGRRVVFFPGSTIGNFDPAGATAFLASLRGLAGERGRVVVGVDLWKDEGVLRAAYDDREGVTAAFNRNALAHLNRRYGATFDVGAFDHVVQVDASRQRVEMHLRARSDTRFAVAGQTFQMRAGETIHTENSYKYTIPGFAALARNADLSMLGAWTDAASRFAVFVFSGPETL